MNLATVHPSACSVRRVILRTYCVLSLAFAVVCCLFSLAALSGTVWAEGAQPEKLNPATAAAGPKIQFSETVFDFGKVIVGQVVKYQFIFTNTGSQVLELKDVKSTCGCTSSGSWTRRVNPGATGKIPIEFHTGAFNGPVTKVITVTINDTNQSAPTLQIKGVVWRPIEVTPEAAAFTGVLDTLSNAVTTIRIVNKEEQPLTLSAPESNYRCVAVELTTNTPGKEYQLTVRLVPPLGLGNVFGNITIKTSSTNMPTLTIPAWVVAQAPIMVTPQFLTLPAQPSANQTTQHVTIRCLWSAPLALSEPAINVPGVSIQLVELQPGRFYDVGLILPPAFELPRGTNVEFKVRSNHPQHPFITVPIVARPAPVATPSMPAPTSGATAPGR
jgi:hypothetical protein